MHREDLMKADLFSEIVLLGSCVAMLVALVLIAAAIMVYPAAV